MGDSIIECTITEARVRGVNGIQQRSVLYRPGGWVHKPVEEQGEGWSTGYFYNRETAEVIII
jgi:hypothetical protein